MNQRKNLKSYLNNDGEKYKFSQVASVILNNQGEILSMIGGSDYTQSQFNRVTQMKRQPGSIFKPFVYLAGVEYGLKPEDEFEDMKTHSEVGSEIIKRNFSNLGDTDYVKMAYEVTRYHHEKWNGKGYPDGLMMNEIPLCARIMAVADVFDAISSDRCYRKALPFDECFKIISKGSAIDFDPLIAQVFISAREEVERTCMDMTIEPETEIIAEEEITV